MGRRRGEALEAAILDAAWDELNERGYTNLTTDSVARRAGTSKPVLYRRWADKRKLVEAAVVRRNVTQLTVPADTGSLRGDLIATLTGASERQGPVLAQLSLLLAGYFAETETSFTELREMIIAGRRSGRDEIMERAIARGEIDPSRLTPRIAALPFDLLRGETMMTLRPVAPEVIEEIVDTIFLPLVRPADGDRSSD
ncbi:TetR/AcrR family transcriptional regulator [Streptomyces clavuligerus]|uniref:TetR/AcrR family transcriptional regulator n=1 Tax=Streptomyces clavuligerus TaxID=1901 RepID=UPI00017FF060|nr:TetR/AcrR family transcriptional regulator [Streptomyces clavuligerus]ANW22344.1 TetR family transcriptional regulator [Streptomyces clavuligerus]AXU17244.1 TetR/AcrR family transcriptional regulator [Streptomyces clavuligerus]EDY47464.1 tetR-family transcriptional regulator [Streptomyces clavuligerus]MBY6307111.1 TetR/AcrR family transcriptional regulator [Streptomyces clavuligerus]QCS10313.1 TetR family transcriptional regulator [Streptomyces clavuligerus]